MTTYTLNLVPQANVDPAAGGGPVTMASESGLDTSVSGGVSVQRTGYIEVPNGTSRKIVEVVDGATFTDTMQTITSFAFIS